MGIEGERYPVPPQSPQWGPSIGLGCDKVGPGLAHNPTLGGDSGADVHYSRTGEPTRFPCTTFDKR